MLLSLQQIYKSYAIDRETFYALKNVNFSIEQGEFVAILGTSGSGKTSLLNILGCLDPVREGTYIFNGKDIKNYSENELAELRNNQIGFVFQSFNLLDKMTVLENVALPLLYRQYSARRRHRVASSILKNVGLGDRMDSLPKHISAGQRQRVAIARSLVNHPKIILADEPTGNLDSVTGAEIMVLFQELRSIYNAAVILVTHDEHVAFYADRIITLFDGYIYADVQVADLKKGLQTVYG